MLGKGGMVWPLVVPRAESSAGGGSPTCWSSNLFPVGVGTRFPWEAVWHKGFEGSFSCVFGAPQPLMVDLLKGSLKSLRHAHVGDTGDRHCGFENGV